MFIHIIEWSLLTRKCLHQIRPLLFYSHSAIFNFVEK